MPVTFEFRRHSIKDGPDGSCLGQKGYAFAREVGKRLLSGRQFDNFFVTPYWRTQQTMAAFAEGAGDFRMKYGPLSLDALVPKAPSLGGLWQACKEAQLRGEDLMEASLSFDRELVWTASKILASEFSTWIGRFNDGARILAVGHSPHIEMLAFGILDAPMRGLRPCEGIRIDVNEGKVSVMAPLGNANIERELFPEEENQG